MGDRTSVPPYEYPSCASASRTYTIVRAFLDARRFRLAEHLSPTNLIDELVYAAGVDPLNIGCATSMTNAPVN